MIKTKNRYNLNISNFKTLVKNKSYDFITYFLIISSPIVLMIFLPEIETMVLGLFIQIFYTISFSLMLKEHCKENNLVILEKQFFEYEYKEKIISYFKFEKKYKKAEKQQI
jgi:hypothetical protein